MDFALSRPIDRCQAISQCAAAWVDGRLRTRKTIQGTSTIPASANSGTTHVAGRQPPADVRVSASITVILV